MSDTPTPTPRTDTAETPLVELLESVPIESRAMIEVGPCHHRNIPYGSHCHDAAKRIRQLQRELAEAKATIERLQATLDLNCEELGRVRAQRDECRELRDQLQAEVERLKNGWDNANTIADQMELERNDARAEVERLKSTLNNVLSEAPCPKCGYGVTASCYACLWKQAEQDRDQLRLELDKSTADGESLHAKVRELQAEVERLRVSTIPATNGYWYEQYEGQRKLALELALDRDRWRECSEKLQAAIGRLWPANVEAQIAKGYALAAYEQLKGKP